MPRDDSGERRWVAEGRRAPRLRRDALSADTGLPMTSAALWDRDRGWQGVGRRRAQLSAAEWTIPDRPEQRKGTGREGGAAGPWTRGTRRAEVVAEVAVAVPLFTRSASARCRCAQTPAPVHLATKLTALQSGRAHGRTRRCRPGGGGRCGGGGAAASGARRRQLRRAAQQLVGSQRGYR